MFCSFRPQMAPLTYELFSNCFKIRISLLYIPFLQDFVTLTRESQLFVVSAELTEYSTKVMEVSQRLKKDPRFIPNLHYPRVLRLEKAKHHWFNVDLKPPLYVTFMSNFLFFLNIMLYNQLSQHTLRTNVYYFCSGSIRNLNWWVPKYYSKGLPQSRFSLKTLTFKKLMGSLEPM